MKNYFLLTRTNKCYKHCNNKLSYDICTYHCIFFKSLMWESLHFFRSPWFSMSCCGVAKRKSHHMTPRPSLDCLPMFITEATAIMPSICVLFQDTSTSGKIKMTRECHDLWFYFHSIWKYHINSCHYSTKIIVISQAHQELLKSKHGIP